MAPTIPPEVWGLAVVNSTHSAHHPLFSRKHHAFHHAQDVSIFANLTHFQVVNRSLRTLAGNPASQTLSAMKAGICGETGRG